MAVRYYFLGIASIMLMVLMGALIALQEKAIATPIPDKQVLILCKDSYGLPVPDMTIAGIVDELKRKKVSINDIFVEYLDFNRNSDITYRINTINSLQYKLAQKQIGLIISISPGVLSSLTHDGKEFLPGVPVITYRSRADDNILEGAVPPLNKIRTSKDVVGTLRYALTLFPATQRLVVINAPGNSKELTNEEISEAIGKVKPQLTVEFKDGLSYEKLLQQVGSLPSNTIVLYGLFFRDATGRTFIPAEVASELGQQSNAPVFCLDDIHIFNGLMGGSVLSSSAIGKQLGELAFDYLNGDITLIQANTEAEIPYTPLFNWQQVERWNADISQLPESSVFYNRPITFWQQYKALVISITSVLIIQAALIISLLVQNRRRRSAEQIVEKERQRLAGIISGTNVGTWEWNVQTGEIIVNDLWWEAIGYTHEEEQLRPLSFDIWTKFVHPDDLKASSDMLNAHFQGQLDHYQLELRMKHKDDTWKWVLARGKVVSWTDDEKPLVMMGTHQNITDHKQAEEAIKQSELRLAKLVDILQHSSETIQDLLDYTLEQIIQLTRSKIGFIYHYDEEHKKNVLNSWSKEVLPAFPVTDPQTCYELEKTGVWGEAVRQRRTLIFNDFEGPNPLVDGSLKTHVHLSKLVTIPIFKDNHIVSVVGLANKETNYDETDVLQVSLLMDAVWKAIDRKQVEEDRKNLQLQLIQTQKMESLGTLAGGIAHDFNNILGAILGFSEMVQENCATGTIMRGDIDQVVKASHRAKELVKQILAFSRQAETEERVLQPALIIKEAIKMLRASLPTTIDIQQNIDPGVGLVLADPTQIHQILTNLCTNALHAMEETGGILSISLTNKKFTSADLIQEQHVQPGFFIEISVGDTGSGISPKIMNKIFDPFFTTKEVGKGTGMGLAIIHGIAKKSGGFVSCQSSQGEGTIFHVYLPVHDDKGAFEIEKKPLVYPLSGRNEHILFVDDEEMLAEMGKTMLERLGYRVTSTTSSVDALTILQKQPTEFDMVITDQTMPDMTGSDLARRLLQIRPGLPIILCTGFSNLISEEKARTYGIMGFAMKPLAKKDLAILIRKVLEGENMIA
jgi:PAS domain S-box-containing protein